MKVSVIGAGSWGTTVAHLCAHNAPTTLYSRDAEAAKHIADHGENLRYLPGRTLHPDLGCVSDLEHCVTGADVIVMGVPSAGMQTTAAMLQEFDLAPVPVVSLAKGLERDTGRRMTEVLEEALPGWPVGVLTGPNLAKEIVDGHAAASVIAMHDAAHLDALQKVFSTDLFRVYTNGDVAGCELGGALKNVIAVAAGMAVGLGTGDNTLAAVITRGLAEISRLGVAMGGEQQTFAGLAGMGDLMATCMSAQSRNRTVGERLGRGQTIEQIMAEMEQVAEGVKSAAVVVELARKHGVEMPIAEEVCAVVTEGRSAVEAYRGLLRRPQQSEHGRRNQRSAAS